MRIARVADVSGSADGGMAGTMLRSGAALGAAGHDVRYIFREELLGRRVPPRLRRVIVPFAVAVRILVLHRGAHLDVAEVHEPIGAVYGFLSSTPWGRKVLPPMVILSHGIEERCWRAVLERRAFEGAATPWWSRLSVRWSIVAQANYSLRRAAHVVVLNAADRSFLLERGMPDDRVSLVPNGVEPEFFGIERSPVEHLRVLYLGTWLERKGVAELTRAWERVHLDHPDATLTLAGVGQLVVQRVFSADCTPSVTTVPRVTRTQLPELLASHDALVLPSWFEGMPLVVLEAAAAAMALVASRIPGVIDILRQSGPESDGGLLFDHKNEGALANALGRLAADGELVAQLQCAARRRAAAFSWDRTAELLGVAYRRATNTRFGGAYSASPASR